ncbi:transcription-repair coupling factor [Lysobacter sp. CAU 1642]|uniref:Transcription-repair-coupling factor n=1 Tax=Pseudomarimonas salicorniae TaxID=2933270 RepID=A0ABT0GJZ6_9GAMM|nr:transcription-repair coupling factor [Lysobacter sp. CAU 1642]
MIRLPALPSQHRRHYWRQPPTGSALAPVVAELARSHPGVVVVVCRDTHGAHALEAELAAFAEGQPVLHFPDWETLPYDLFSPHPEIVSQRVATLYRLPAAQRGILVVPVTTLMQQLPPTRFIGGNALVVETGGRLDLDAEKRRLESAGYRNVPQVLDPGDFAVRGALLDVFPMGAAEPYRIELLDDEIDSIRTFDPETQRSDHRVDSVRMLPAREFPLDDDSARRVRERLRADFDIDPRRCALYQDLKQGGAPAGIEYYLPLFFDSTASLFDYLDEGALFLVAEGALEAAEAFWTQTGERYEQRRHDRERPVLAPEALYLGPEPLRAALNLRRRIELVGEGHPRHGEAAKLDVVRAPELPLQPRADDPAQALRGFLGHYPGSVLLAADSPGRREALIEQLAEHGLKPEPVESISDWRAAGLKPRWAITVAPLEDGFAAGEPAFSLLTERQLFPERATQGRRRRRAVREPEAVLRDLSEISPGAPIVHEDHGVGRYQGLITLDAGGQANEFLCIEYAKGDKLYVPVAQLHLVSRYSGASDELAPLHSLGGDAWEKARRKAAEKVRDVAAELLEIQAKRQARAGLALELDRQLYDQFAAQFPFEETPDQLTAIDAVIRDLGGSTPMDRVVCGDVGFGKTEVAVRAAFVAATAGRQVALLVPTTLLAEQHYRNFRDRFADWPIRVEVLSRFKTPKEIKAALAQLADGQLDVIVGTHRLLQGDVKFKDLGLVIVDEEQRFGVRQKEALKALRAEVHLLTLTATPIPRTLNMAMAGLRDLSIIATPPAHRLAVKTFVSQWDGAQLREAFQRELARGGQVYFLHNEVETIEKMARELGELVPEARIRIAHGQMPERELEQVMLDFHRQRFNVLVCTTIIESGIDIPSANTIIVNRADRFGLAQLHQLRGRVGRSHHRAYAYLVVPDKRSITGDAQKRLEALASLEELGAGFTLATHDLEIRGAGELLGEEQSGQIAEVGFSLYTELLERAVRSIKQGKIPDLDGTDHHGPEVELHVPALIPDDYLPDVHTRLTLYKRIASARDAEALSELQVEMIDRFGLLPDQVKNLFATTGLKLQAEPLGIRRLELGERGGRVQFVAKPPIDPVAIIGLLQKQPKVYAMDGPDKLKLRLELPDAASRFRAAREVLDKLAGKP